MQRTEIPHNTEDQVRGYLALAAELADEIDHRDAPAWRAIFTAAYSGVSAKQLLLEAPAPIDLSGILTNGRR